MGVNIFFLGRTDISIVVLQISSGTLFCPQLTSQPQLEHRTACQKAYLANWWQDLENDRTAACGRIRPFQTPAKVIAKACSDCQIELQLLQIT